MQALRPLHFQMLIAVFERAGFIFSRQHGDHLIYTKAGVKRPLVVPMYREVPVFVIRNLLRTAGMNREEFLNLVAKV